MSEKVQALEALRQKRREAYRYLDSRKIQIGDFTYGEPVIRSWGEDARIIIGKFCSIGGNVQFIMGGNHRNDWITTYPFNQLLPAQYGEIKGHPMTKGDIVIGNDVWICSDVKILSGVHIGDGATIAASAVVSKDVEPFSIVAGNPAKRVKGRFDAGTVARMSIRWWDWPLEKLAEAVPLLQSDDVEGLIRFDREWGA